VRIALPSFEKSSLANSTKPIGVGAVLRLWIMKGRTIFVADAHRGDGKRFVVSADEKLTAFLNGPFVSQEARFRVSKRPPIRSDQRREYLANADAAS